MGKTDSGGRNFAGVFLLFGNTGKIRDFRLFAGRKTKGKSCLFRIEVLIWYDKSSLCKVMQREGNKEDT